MLQRRPDQAPAVGHRRSAGSSTRTRRRRARPPGGSRRSTRASPAPSSDGRCSRRRGRPRRARPSPGRRRPRAGRRPVGRARARGPGRRRRGGCRGSARRRRSPASVASTIARRPVICSKRSSPGRTPPVRSAGRSMIRFDRWAPAASERGADVGQLVVVDLADAWEEHVGQAELRDATARPSVERGRRLSRLVGIALEHRHVVAVPCQQQRRRQPTEAAADDHDPRHVRRPPCRAGRSNRRRLAATQPRRRPAFMENA